VLVNERRAQLVRNPGSGPPDYPAGCSERCRRRSGADLIPLARTLAASAITSSRLNPKAASTSVNLPDVAAALAEAPAPLDSVVDRSRPTAVEQSLPPKRRRAGLLAWLHRDDGRKA
jgi:hypothetical protein